MDIKGRSAARVQRVQRVQKVQRVMVSPLRAMSMKSALRIHLSVSYGMIGILQIGSLRSPPYPAPPDFPLCRGQNKTPRNTLFISGSTVSTGYSAPACGGKVVAPATKGGLHFRRPQGGCKGFIQTGAFYQLKGAHHHPLNPLNLLNPGAKRRLNLQAPKGLVHKRGIFP